MNINDCKTKKTVFTLRMDKELFEKVRQEAKDERRSIAKQIEFIVDKYFND